MRELINPTTRFQTEISVKSAGSVGQAQDKLKIRMKSWTQLQYIRFLSFSTGPFRSPGTPSNVFFVLSSFLWFSLFGLDARASLSSLVSFVSAELVASASVRLGVLAVETTEVLGDLTSVATALKEDGVLASGALKSELIEGNSTATSLDDAVSRGLSESEGSNVELGDREKAIIVDNGADNNGNNSLLVLGDHGADLGDGEGGAVDTGHAEALENNLVEVGLSAASKEAVELGRDEQTRKNGLAPIP